MSLKKKIIAVFLLFITIPMVILGVFSYISFSNSMQKTIEQQLSTEGAQTARYFNQSIDTLDKYMQVLSTDQKFANFINGNTAGRDEIYSYLAQLQAENNNIETLAITDSNGKEVINNKSSKTDIDLVSHNYVQSALMGYSKVSDVMRSPVTGNTVISIAYPLKLNDKVVGTIVGSIDYKKVCEDVSKIKVAKNGFAYIVNNSGLIVYHPDSKKVLKTKISDYKNSELSALFTETLKNKKITMGYYTLFGVKKFAVFTPVGKWVVILEADYNDYMSSVISVESAIIIITLLCIILSILLSYFIVSRSILNPIKSLERLILKAGTGDFTVRSEIKTRDEIQSLGEHFDKMVVNQSNMIKKISNYSEDLSAASQELAASTEEITHSSEQVSNKILLIASNAKDQHDLITEVSEALVQLLRLVNTAQKKASTAELNSKVTMDTAIDGRSKIENTVEAIKNIRNASEEAENNLKLLNELSKKIGGITSTINAIAEQTNLLALNAAIEAARAGEHGKGFTVVSDEVRKLSIQTNSEANEISSLIREMTLLSEKAVDSMQINKEAVKKGVDIVNETDKSFINIISAVKQIYEDIIQISDVTKEEVINSDQIVQLIDSVATIIEATAVNSKAVADSAGQQVSIVENVAKSTKQASEMAMNMHGLINEYTY